MYWFITRDDSLQIQLYNTNSYIYIVQNKKVATSSIYIHRIYTDEPAKASNNLDYNAQQKLAKYKKTHKWKLTTVIKKVVKSGGSGGIL